MFGILMLLIFLGGSMWKVAVMVFNGMFLLLFISTVVGEWGEPPSIIAGIGIVSIVINSIYILLRTKGGVEG